VQAGDTLSSIAATLQTTPQALASANHLHDSDVIYVGQQLNVPGDYQHGASDYGSCQNSYRVQWGDTLSDIAWRHSTSVEALRQSNSLHHDTIREGQSLCVPGGSNYDPRPQSTAGGHYQVKPGDTVAAIAKWHGVSVEAIIHANHLSAAGLIRVGQTLVIPGHQQPVHGHKPKQRQPKKPDYTEHDYPDQDAVCTNPIDVWTHQDRALVEVVSAWCAIFDYADDANGMTAVVVRTTGRTGAAVKIQRGNDEPITLRTDPASGLGDDMLIYYTSPGYYLVWVESEEPSEIVKFDLPPGKHGWVDFKLANVSQNPRPRSADGWSGRVAENWSETSPQNGVSSVIIVKAPAPGLPIRIKAEGEFSALCYTGQKPEHGPGACEFGGLWPGKYTLTLEGSGASVEVYVDGIHAAEIVFDRAS
jgi:LysM repeat protein